MAIRFRRGTAAALASLNETLEKGQPCWETDTNRLKMGDGVTAYNSLAYLVNNGTGVATFLATPSSANLASAVTDETGTGALVFGTSPTLASPTITGTTTLDQIDNPLLTTVLTVDPIPTSSYRLDETSGTNANDSAGSIDGTYTGSPTLAAAGYVRGQANALQIAASGGQRVELGNNFVFANLTPFSVDGWFYRTGGSVASIIGKRVWTGAINQGWLVYYYNGDQKIHFARWNTAGTANEITSGVISDSTWYHVAATFSGTVLNLYINGELAATTSSSIVNVHTTTHAAAIGNSLTSPSTWSDYFVGRLQMWNVYTSALTALQVKKLYYAGSDYIVTGSRGSNAALTSLINALVAKGIITDGTT